MPATVKPTLTTAAAALNKSKFVAEGAFKFKAIALTPTIEVAEPMAQPNAAVALLSWIVSLIILSF